MKKNIQFSLNKKEYIHDVNSIEITLLEFLRSLEVNLTGTKYGCGQGGCGACSVIEIKNTSQGRVIKSINACLTPLTRIDGSHIITIEGISKGIFCSNNLVVQEEMKKCNATQCGYCSPGFVVNMYSLILNGNHKEEQNIEDAFGGNICRCTGYASILKAMKNLKGVESKLIEEGFPNLSRKENLAIELKGKKWTRPDSIKELIETLKVYSKNPWETRFVNGNTSSGIYDENFHDFFIDISSINELKQVTSEQDTLTIGGGVTYSQLLTYLQNNSSKNQNFPDIVKHISQIAGNQVRNLGTIGGALSLVKKYGSSESIDVRELEPFPSDFFVIAMTYEAEVSIISHKGIEKTINLTSLPELNSSDAIYLIKSVQLKIDNQIFARTYRIAKRIQNSHPIVNSGFNFMTDGNKIKEAKIIYGAIGKEPNRLSKTEEYLKGKQIDRLEIDTLESEIYKELEKLTYVDKKSEINRAFKLSIALKLFRKYYLELCEHLSIPIDKREKDISIDRGLSMLNRSHIVAPYYDLKTFSKKIAFSDFDLSIESISSKSFEVLSRTAKDDIDFENFAKVTTEIGEVVNRDELSKVESDIQLNGKAKYIYDIYGPKGVLHGYYVYSTIGIGTFKYNGSFFKNIAKIKQVDSSIEYVSFDDIPNKEYEDSRFKGYLKEGKYGGDYDPIFAEYNSTDKIGYLTSFGQPIGLVLSDSYSNSKKYAEILIESIDFTKDDIGVYEFNHTTIPEDRLVSKSYHLKNIERIKDIRKRDTSKIELGDTNSITGYQNVGAQIHFYMEPNVTVVIPTDDGGMEIYCSSQFLTRIQEMVTNLLNPNNLYPRMIPSSKIIVKTTRLGGGFGAKELRPKFYAGAAAIASHKTGLPVRLALNREIDSIMTGTRHPAAGKFRINGNRDGKITQLKYEFNLNIGNSWDCSYPVMELILLSSDGAYNIDNFHAEGKMYLTNIQSRTAFRSFGLIQCSIIREEAIEKFAHLMKLRPDEVREKNFYKDATIDNYDYTPYGQPLKHCRINQVWNDLKKKADFETRWKKVEEFNSKTRWKKKGISIIPIKYGISYTFRPYNFGNAFVLIYGDDGSVIVHHGGIEMGQGIHTKLVQIASDSLCISHKFIKIGESGTNKIPNAASTGASTGSDLNGAAVKNACLEIRNRLVDFLKSDSPEVNSVEYFKKLELLQDEHFRYIIDNIDEANFDDETWKNYWGKSWNKIVQYALISRVNLSAEGFFRSPGFGAIDPKTGKFYNEHNKRIFYYFTYSAAISEVEIDVLTGEFNIIRTDIAYDAGRSLNSKIDYGQIEGGFVQGIGYVTTEKVIYDDSGELVTQNTWKYKPPCTKTIPEEFNVFLMRYEPTDDQSQVPLDNYGIQSSKSTGEPPLVLASSVFFALKQAILAARKEHGINDWIHIDSPLSIEKIFKFANCLEDD